ncbi:MAG: heme o synthase [Gemmatimonadota bacterium]|nr:heme o synthase [Gemmatimonadota bacterium]
MAEAARRPARVRSAARPSPARLGAWVELTKPGIALYMTLTAGAAAFVALNGRPGAGLVLHVLLGTALGSGGALALNQVAERDLDARMQRTRGRPIPSGRLGPAGARAFGLLLLAAGTAWLFFTVGPTAAALGLASAATYHWLYRPLKRRSWLSVPAGAVPGAMPVLIGWSAATGRVDAAALSLFLVAWLWQHPHVLGLAWMLREDHARVGFRMAPPGPRPAARIGRWAVAACALLVPAGLLPWILGAAGPLYAAGMTLLGAAFLGRAVVSARALALGATPGTRPARDLFLASLAWHPAFLLLLVVDVLAR